MTITQLAITILFLGGFGAVLCFSRQGRGWKVAGALLAILIYVLSQIHG